MVDYFSNTGAITKGRVIKYSALPGLFPRIKHLLAPSKGYLALWMALIYHSVRLLPTGHTYLNPANRGNFGIRHVVAEASHNIKWEWKHLDQIIVYFTILAGLIMFTLQFVALAVSIFALPAFAFVNSAGATIPVSPFKYFVTPKPEQDLAFILLDLVFGAVGIFKSCVTTGVACESTSGDSLNYSIISYPTPYQTALRETLAMYSFGLFIVGVLIIIYNVISITGESAATGIPFGRRMNKLWAPVRLILFSFLIVPFVGNFNMAQMATFYSARMGSSLATNAWTLFNSTLTLGSADILSQHDLSTTPANEVWLAKSKAPEVGGYLQFMQTVTACKYAEKLINDRYIQAYIVINPAPGLESAAYYLDKEPVNEVPTSPEPVNSNFANAELAEFKEALAFSDGGDIVIRYGEYNPELYPNQKGNVYPWCGELVLRNPGVTANANPDDRPAIYYTFEGYYQGFAVNSWVDDYFQLYGTYIAENDVFVGSDTPMPSSDEILTLVKEYKEEALINMDLGRVSQIAKYSEYGVPTELLEKGWAGAAIWYNMVADINGGYVDAIHNFPQPTLWPDAMEQIMKARRANNDSVSDKDKFNPVLDDGRMVRFQRAKDAQIARIERFAYMLWQNESSTVQATDTDGTDREIHPTNRPLIDFINAIYGTSGLFDMRDNAEIHPLAQLSAIGKDLINSSINAFGFATGITIGGMLGVLNSANNGFADMLSGMAMSIAATGFIAGFILYYILPFMPFVYFFFAVAGWVKAIFEAMVGVPLWALAHLRMDGEGLPGSAGMNGYFLIFEILVRPILIVFGLIAAISIMTAMVRVLNDVFDLVVVNLTGHSTDAAATDATDLEFYREAIDQFCLTILYVIICYLIALSCFKLIDLVPDQILRWMGMSIPIFGDAEKDSASNLLRTASMGVMSAAGRFGAGVNRTTLLSTFTSSS